VHRISGPREGARADEEARLGEARTIERIYAESFVPTAPLIIRRSRSAAGAARTPLGAAMISWSLFEAGPGTI
jgi:hypothetical protein